MDATADRTAAIGRQYERWPYPKVPLLAVLPSTHPWQLHCDWLWDRCGSGVAPRAPRIWIAGCGTFQPYAFAVANPRAEILATDLSQRSLAIAARRCRLHGVRNVRFARLDLTNAPTWPEGGFDLIECYGVLMNVPDPAAVLRELGRRLSPRGVLRVMVYPHFSRRRIFQLQRLARLCGFHAGDDTHPRRFRALVRSLPRSHPLRHAFTTYADSRHDIGVVDAFLHAGDRGFTATGFGAMVAEASLLPACWMHRPWAQPELAAARLGLQGRAQDFVLGYLDLWQELRQNLVACLRRSDAPPRAGGPERPHPVFAEGHGSLRHALRLLRLRVCGGRVPTRTGSGDVVLRAVEARALAGEPARLPEPLRRRLRETGLLLGGQDHAPAMPPHEAFPGEAEFLASAAALRVGRLAPNPFYSHLFAAYELDRTCQALGLPDLETQLGRWLPFADPLEHRRVPFGLTPYGTMQRHRQSVLDHLGRAPLPAAEGWHAVRLRGDRDKLAEARAFLRDAAAPAAELDDAALRELWLLRFGYGELFVSLFWA